MRMRVSPVFVVALLLWACQIKCQNGSTNLAKSRFHIICPGKIIKHHGNHNGLMEEKYKNKNQQGAFF